MLYKYLRCGHIGRKALRANAFIRVAETRNNPVELVGDNKACPSCHRSEA